MSIFSSLFGGGSKRKAAAQAAAEQQQIAANQASQMAVVSQQQAEADKRLGRSARASRGRRLLRYAKGAAGTMGL